MVVQIYPWTGQAFSETMRIRRNYSPFYPVHYTRVPAFSWLHGTTVEISRCRGMHMISSLLAMNSSLSVTWKDVYSGHCTGYISCALCSMHYTHHSKCGTTLHCPIVKLLKMVIQWDRKTNNSALFSSFLRILAQFLGKFYDRDNGTRSIISL